MGDTTQAARAYATSYQHRSVREQEGDIFRQANAALARVQEGGAINRARALADNDRLWSAVVDLVKDPQNRLPVGLKGSIVSVGLTVLRDLRSDEPDIGFVMSMNDSMATALSMKR